MKFLYLRDPLFRVSVVVYALNRAICKPFFPNRLSQQYVNDVLCIPFWVPIMLFLLRKVHLRADDNPPSSYEILIPLVVWAMLFEVYLPHTKLFHGVAFSDHIDVLCYSIGAFVSSVFWHIRYYQCCKNG